MPTPAQSLYSTLQYWRSAGIRGLEVLEIEEPGPSPKQLLDKKKKLFAEEEQKCLSCEACTLCKNDHRIYGQGSLSAEVVFITDVSRPEDVQGKGVLLGETGELFDRMLSKMNLSRDQIYLCHSVKCPTPDGREAKADEVEPCREILLRQIQNLKPKVICTLGSRATNHLLDIDSLIAKIRGKTILCSNTPVVPTFHPSYLLKKKSARKDVWKDMQLILSLIQTRT